MRLDGLVLWAEVWLTRHRSVVALVVLAGAAGLAGWMLSRPSVSTPPLEETIPYASGVPTTAIGQAGSVANPSTDDALSAAPSEGQAGGSTTGDESVPGAEAEPAELVVHVVGAVRRPGLISVAPGARVGDAIIAAGGPAEDAADDVLNLAQPVEDGMQVRVPTIEEVASARRLAAEHDHPVTTRPLIRRSGDHPDGQSEGAAGDGPINLNTASTDELEALPGVGPATAAAIVAWREDNGLFGSVDDLDLVPGIGPAKLAAVRDLVTL